MFADRIRNLTLALAGATLIATSLISSAALAAPSESRPSPAHAETVATEPNQAPPRPAGSIDLVRMELGEFPKYKFVVRNNRPGPTSFQVGVEAMWRDCQGCAAKVDRLEETVTLEISATREYVVECKGPICLGAYGEMKLVDVDPREFFDNDLLLH